MRRSRDIEKNRISSWEDIERYLELESELVDTESSIVEDPYKWFSPWGRKKNYQYQKERLVYGYKSNIQSKYQQLEKKYNDSVLERVYKLTQIIACSVGYNTLRKFRAIDLLTLLGGDYKDILELCQKSGLFKLVKIESPFSSPDDTKHHIQISVLYRKNKKNKSQFERCILKCKTAINAFHNYRKARSHYRTEREQLIKELTEYNLNAARFIGDSIEEKRYNKSLHYLNQRALIGRYCHRVYCLITEVSREIRKNIRPMHDIYARIRELDIKASQPFFLVQLILNPGLVRLAFKNERVVRLLEHIIYSIDFSDELIRRLQEAIRKDFYTVFLKPMLNTLDPDWQLTVESILSPKDLNKLKKANNKERFLLKKASAILQNSNPRTVFWTSKMIGLMKRNLLYNGLGCLIDELNNNSLDLSALLVGKDKEELSGMKEPYMPYKNLGIIIFRIESFMMQEVFIGLNGTWCLLIHDAILCTEKDTKKVLECFEETFSDYGLDMPRIDM